MEFAFLVPQQFLDSADSQANISGPSLMYNQLSTLQGIQGNARTISERNTYVLGITLKK